MNFGKSSCFTFSSNRVKHKEPGSGISGVAIDGGAKLNAYRKERVDAAKMRFIASYLSMKQYNRNINDVMKWAVCLLMMMMFACSEGADNTDSVELPTTNYMIIGTVVDESDTSHVLSDFQVIISLDNLHPYTDTVFTKTDGTFVWEEPVSTFGKDLKFSIQVTDENDNDTTQYTPFLTYISFRQDELELDDDFSSFLGEAKKEILIKMKKKSNRMQ
ncbi:hypothetical protein AGMMS49574_10930 [Bacteroidia bacterium]|nr:hypothetical protein AGMMS49574_10930 [Bacteroidia bacterium]